MSVTYDRVFTHDDATALIGKQTDIKNGIDALTTAVGNINNTAVYDGNGDVITSTYLKKTGDIATGSTNGTISVDGTDVAVKNCFTTAGGTLTGDLTVSKSAPVISETNTALTRGTYPASTYTSFHFRVADKDDKTINGLRTMVGTDFNAIGLYTYHWKSGNNPDAVVLNWSSDETVSFYPSPSDVIDLGRYGNRWKTLYAGGGDFTGTVTQTLAGGNTSNPTDCYVIKCTNVTSGSSSSNRTFYGLHFVDSAGADLGGFYTRAWSTNWFDHRIRVVWDENSISYQFAMAGFQPLVDNVAALGGASYRWTTVYAATASINTSDERLKDNITAIPNEVLDAWGEVGWYQFQFKDSIATKGENARIHTGTIAQRIKDVFESHDLDAFRYGLLCYDEWDAEEEEKDENGNVINEGREAGTLYSLRYEEALCMEAAYQRRRADRLEERIARLEQLLIKEEPIEDAEYEPIEEEQVESDVQVLQPES